MLGQGQVERGEVHLADGGLRVGARVRELRQEIADLLSQFSDASAVRARACARACVHTHALVGVWRGAGATWAVRGGAVLQAGHKRATNRRALPCRVSETAHSIGLSGQVGQWRSAGPLSCKGSGLHAGFVRVTHQHARRF